MELTDAARRILRQHWVLIAVCVALGVVAAAIHAHEPSMYTASTRLVIGTDDPKSRTESGSIADTGKAIATSLTQVRRALEDAHVTDRNPVDVAKKHVFVRGLGTSGVVQLSVSDKDPDVARAVANALALRVIRVRGEVTSGQLQSVLADLRQRVDDLNDKIATVDQKIDRLNIQIALSAPTTGNALRAQRDALAQQRDFLAQQRSVLEGERISVLSAGALRPRASVISAANQPTHADPTPLLQEVILGALLGLVLGIGIAGLIESFRPTLVGSDSLARQFDTPLLGTIPVEGDDQQVRHDLRRIALRIRLAAAGVELPNVGLVAVGPDVELGLVAAMLDELANGVATTAAKRTAVGAETATEPVAAGSHSVPFRIRPFGMLDGAPSNGQMALVLVSPSVVKKSDIDDASHLLRVAGSPLLGLVTYERPREPRARPSLSAVRPR
ncbi:MAG: hypothetical protein ACJ74L_04085 [Gaiellaceae bacterium]